MLATNIFLLNWLSRIYTAPLNLKILSDRGRIRVVSPRARLTYWFTDITDRLTTVYTLLISTICENLLKSTVKTTMLGVIYNCYISGEV